jgi:hypothetical protein
LKTDVTSDFSVTAITTLALLHISSSAVGSTTQWSPICRCQYTITFTHLSAYKRTPTARSYVSMSLAHTNTSTIYKLMPNEKLYPKILQQALTFPIHLASSPTPLLHSM